LGDSDQRYNFVCPACSGHLSIPLERIPPVQARFRCPHCKKPMDFPSREEARAQIQAKAAAGTYAGGSAPVSAVKEAAPAGGAPVAAAPAAAATVPAREGQRFRIEKPGYQMDVFDRRGVRNLIRTRELLETDKITVDESPPVTAGELPYLQSLFALAKKQNTHPPACCRTHTDKIAFFRCHNSGRPLCEDCAAEKKFGGQTIRVCQHCGGTAVDLIEA
jgi:transposase-like protein